MKAILTRRVALHSAIILGVGSLGLWLSYGPLTSITWFWAYGAQMFRGDYRNLGGVAEGLRLVMIVAFYVIGSLFLFRPESERFWRRSKTIADAYRWTMRRRRRWMGTFCVGAITAIIGYHLIGGPLQLSAEAASAGLRFAPPIWWRELREYNVPYVAYALYSCCTYLGIALPLFLVVLAAISRDRRSIGRLARGYATDAPASLSLEGRAVAAESYFRDVRLQIHRIADRYLWMFILLALYWAVELSTNLIITLACWAQELTKWSAAAFAAVVLPYFIVRLFNTYWREYDRCMTDLDGVGRKAVTVGDTAGARAANEIQGRFEQEFTGIAFITYLTKTGAISALVLVTIAVGGLRLANERHVRMPVILQRTLPAPLPALLLNGWELLRQHRPTAVNGTAETGDTERVPCLWCPTCIRRGAVPDLRWKGRPLSDWTTPG